MSTSKINLSITLILFNLFIFLSSSNASSRLNFEKVSPAPAPNNTPLHTNLKKNSSVRSENRSDRNRPSPSPSEVGRFMDDKYCVDALQRCGVGEDLFACIHHDDIVNYDKWVVLVQNAGETTLDVNITVPTSVLIDLRTIKLVKHQSQKIHISTAIAPKIVKINLATYKGNCSLQINAKPSFSDWIPAYSSKSTPIYAAYFMFFTIIIVGCIFTCCKFSSRKREARMHGISYQQIEMGNQMQSATGIVEESTSYRWDENWDDEWDEEGSTVAPAISDNKFRTNGNGSNNGIPLKISDKKEDWDSDWDA